MADFDDYPDLPSVPNAEDEVLEGDDGQAQTEIPVCENDTVSIQEQNMYYSHDNSNISPSQNEDFDSQATEPEDFSTHAQLRVINSPGNVVGTEYDIIYRYYHGSPPHTTPYENTRAHVGEWTESAGSSTFASSAATYGVVRRPTDFSIAGLLGSRGEQPNVVYSPVLSETEAPCLRSPESAVTYVHNEPDMVDARLACTETYNDTFADNDTDYEENSAEERKKARTPKKIRTLAVRTPKAIERKGGKKKGKITKTTRKIKSEPGTDSSETSKKRRVRPKGPGGRTKAAFYNGQRVWECLEGDCVRCYTTCTALFFHMKKQHKIEEPRQYYRQKANMPCTKLQPVHRASGSE
eukprot:comp19186_c0_seq1/m.21895 comp19186_c0_seq1/g.21895  ORF comp19186_c0_seq1/g.21895 comp19186_c0_seq1/m.21895 type:complete len:352 (-) comp19186_c0_seq1:778-1833(-)